MDKQDNIESLRAAWKTAYQRYEEAIRAEELARFEAETTLKEERLAYNAIQKAIKEASNGTS